MTLHSLQAALAKPRRHFSPFLVLGDPDADRCVALAEAAVEAGASMLELGLPFSDPCADGPVVQRAMARARGQGVSTDAALAVLARISVALPDVPKNLLVYGNLVHARGAERFCADAVQAGASSLLVPDLPYEAGASLREACAASGLGSVSLVGPQTADDRLDRLADAARGAFVYVAAHQGVTGVATQCGSAAAGSATSGSGASERDAFVQRIRARTDVPLCVGFGLSTRDDLDSVFAAGARIAIVGSHLLRVVESALVSGDSASALSGAFRASCAALVRRAPAATIPSATPLRES